MSLTLETREQANETAEIGPLRLAPPVDEDYWKFRVVVSQDPFQAVVGFPKYATIGIGFAVEEDDWNTNLPYSCSTEKIVEWIWKNRLPLEISRDLVTRAVIMVQAASYVLQSRPLMASQPDVQ